MSALNLNRNTRGTSIQVGARHNDQFPKQGVELLQEGTRLQHSPADANHHPLEHGSNQLRIGRERLAGSREHADDGLMEPGSHLLRDFRSVPFGAYGVESNTGLRVPHFGLKERGDESSRHFAKRFTRLFRANVFDSFLDPSEMTFQGGL
jgi:hypothetical protein